MVIHVVPKAGSYNIYTVKDNEVQVQDISVLKNIDEDDIPIILSLEEDTYLNKTLCYAYFDKENIYKYILDTVSKIKKSDIIEYINEIEVCLPYIKEFDISEESYKSDNFYSVHDFYNNDNKTIIIKVPVEENCDYKELKSIVHLINKYSTIYHTGYFKKSLVCPNCFSKVQKNENYISVESYRSDYYLDTDSFYYSGTIFNKKKKCPCCGYEDNISKFKLYDTRLMNIINYLKNIEGTSIYGCSAGHSWYKNDIYVTFSTKNTIFENSLNVLINDPEYRDLLLSRPTENSYRISTENILWYGSYLTNYNSFKEYQDYFINKILKFFKQCMNDNT